MDRLTLEPTTSRQPLLAGSPTVVTRVRTEQTCKRLLLKLLLAAPTFFDSSDSYSHGRQW
jgi:hypothetical protein